jgi:GntR family transcriptional regulator
MVRRKHEPIVSALARDIRAGRFDRGERLPGEVALAESFAVSRNTVRAALAQLCDEGLIATHSGKGSYVLYDGRRLVGRRGWAHALDAQGVDAPPRVLSIAVAAAPDLAGLGLDPAEVMVVERVRELHGEHAISYERSRVPAQGRLARMPVEGLVEGSLVATLAAAGLRIHHGNQVLSARRLTGEEAVALGRSEHDWFLHSRRTSFDEDGRFVEDVESLLDPDHFQLGLDFVSGA